MVLITAAMRIIVKESIELFILILEPMPQEHSLSLSIEK